MPQEQDALYIELRVEPDNGHVFVRSDQVPGLHLMGSCFQEMKSALEKAIKRLFKDNEGLDVNIIWLTSHDAQPPIADVATHLERLAVYTLPQAA